MTPLLRVAALVAISTLGMSGVAGAAGDDQKVAYTGAGQAAARAAVLTGEDFAAPGNWKGGAIQPDLTPIRCPGFRPKQSDLTLVGAAASLYTYGASNAMNASSLIEVLQTPKMVQQDWERTVGSPRLTGCIGSLVKGAFAGSATFISIRKLALPGLARRASAWRAVLVGTTGPKLRFVSDLILMRRGRTEISLSVVAPASLADSATAVGARLITRMYERAKA